MNRIDQRFAQLKAAGRTGLIPFVTAGDPLPDATVPLLHALVAAGADLIELGMPFSDPMADGPVIQRANERALARKVGLTQVLEMVRIFRRDDTHTPLVLMGYLNPIEIRGVEHFAEEAASAGVDGLLLVDSPLDDAALCAQMQARHLHLIRLLAPTSSATRMHDLAARASGFLYFVSITGVTGAARADAAAIAAQVRALRQQARVPVAVGFGVKDAAGALAIASFADAVVIGSALVEYLQGSGGDTDVGARARAFLAPIRAALDARKAA
ncbi:tryptophan synthase, alpha subunit [mine drainage metagenome]|uniref:tryptophan synthase n=1 Tax=mine drainage metagenome TaxID=410659 RepID=T1C0Z0_9ZZZZ